MSAQIGWIDFSEKDRKKALDVIHLLQEQGAVDELGIGIIRDAFANLFFPGTSTVQTRAKYFFIIPYVMKEVCSNSKYATIDRIIRVVDEEEHNCAKIMGDNDGVIGRDVLPNWVERKPSNIYWNGLKRLGIFTYPKYSATEYYREELRRRALNTNDSGNRSGEENEQDDEKATARGLRGFWNLPPEYEANNNWRETLTIDLLPWEARWMRKCISENLSGSLFKYVVDNNIDVETISKSGDTFKALTTEVEGKLDKETVGMMKLANQFNSLVYLSRILYNIILSDGNNKKANELWECEQSRLKDVAELNLDVLFANLKINNTGVRTFVIDMKQHLTEGNINAAKQRIISREIQLKGEKRAKLMRRADFSDQAWVGGYMLDYRLGSAARLIKDIYKAEREAYVQE